MRQWWTGATGGYVAVQFYLRTHSIWKEFSWHNVLRGLLPVWSKLYASQNGHVWWFVEPPKNHCVTQSQVRRGPSQVRRGGATGGYVALCSTATGGYVAPWSEQPALSVHQEHAGKEQHKDLQVILSDLSRQHWCELALRTTSPGSPASLPHLIGPHSMGARARQGGGWVRAPRFSFYGGRSPWGISPHSPCGH